MTYEITSQTIKVDHLQRDNITTILDDGENIIKIATYPREDQAWIGCPTKKYEWSEWVTDCMINDEWFEDYDIPRHHSALERYSEHKICVHVIFLMFNVFEKDKRTQEILLRHPGFLKKEESK